MGSSPSLERPLLGLRPRQGLRRRRRARIAGPRPVAVADARAHGDAGRGHPRHRRLHVARAGPRPARGQARRHLGVRRRPLGDAHGATALRRGKRLRRARGGAPGGARPGARAGAHALPARGLPGPGPRPPPAGHRRRPAAARRRVGPARRIRSRAPAAGATLVAGPGPARPGGRRGPGRPAAAAVGWPSGPRGDLRRATVDTRQHSRPLARRKTWSTR